MLTYLRSTLRRLARERGFTATVLLTLALCLGANITIYAVVDAILVRSLPFPEPDRLVTPIKAYPLSGVQRAQSSIADYYASRERVKSFAFAAIIQSGRATVDEVGVPRHVPIDRISPEFFATLGVPLLTGRAFTDDEMLPGRGAVAIITYGFWRRNFNADPHVLGRTFAVDGAPMTIVGVLPADFHYLSSRAQFYTPATSNPADRVPTRRHADNAFELIARLAPGATIASVVLRK